jgi:hypothetical protein
VNLHQSFLPYFFPEKFANTLLFFLKISEDDIFAKYFLPLCFVCAKKFYGKIIAVVEIKQMIFKNKHNSIQTKRVFLQMKVNLAWVGDLNSCNPPNDGSVLL